MMYKINAILLHRHLGCYNSSRDLQLIYTKSFINRLHLILQISKIPSQKILGSNETWPHSSTDMSRHVGTLMRGLVS